MSSSHAELRHLRWHSLSLLLAAELILGLAHIAVLPPWEGFDETGHFSSIQQIADTRVIPRLPWARMSGTTEDYRAAAPVAYSSLAPFDANGGVTYRAFFSTATQASLAGAEAAVHGRPQTPRQFTAGSGGNHIAQHPPVFYWAMVPFYEITRPMSLGAQLFVLRAVSYGFAWLALVIGVVVAWRHLPAMPQRNVALIAAALWPLAVPSWFPAMARLGNDSLVALILALLWWWLAARGWRTWGSAVVVGILLGVGAMTKALVVPVAAGTIGWCLVQAWRSSAPARRGAIVRAAIIGVIVAAIAGPWYLGPSALAIAGEESVRLEQLGGLVAALRQQFSMRGYAEGVSAFLGMAVWSGTWSLARPPYLTFVPLMIAAIGGAWVFLRSVRGPDARPWRLLVWWIAPVLAGFAYHILVHVALTGTGRGVGGYYLHVLVAPLAGASGLVAARVWARARFVLVSVFAYAVVFAAVVAWAQLLLFAGFLDKGPDKFFVAPEALPAWLGVPEALTRLDTIAFPHTALWLVIAGVLMLAVGLAGVRGRPRPPDALA